MSTDEQDKKDSGATTPTTPAPAIADLETKPKRAYKKRMKAYEPSKKPQIDLRRANTEEKRFGVWQLEVPYFSHGKVKGASTKKESIAVNDPQFVASPADPNPATLDPRVVGIDFPTVKQNFNIVDRARWLLAVEQMMQVGILMHKDISRISGLPNIHVANFYKEVQEGWSENLSRATVNIRREAMHREADIIKERCWVQIDKLEGMPEEKQSVAVHNALIGYYRMVLEASKRQAMLSGLDKIEVQIENTVTVAHKTEDTMLEELQAKVALPIDALEGLAKQLAMHIKK